MVIRLGVNLILIWKVLKKTTAQNIAKFIKENPIPSKKQTYIVNCKKCGKQFQVFITPNLFEKGKYTKHCSRSCANSRDWTYQNKLKVSISAKKSQKVKLANNSRKLHRITKTCVFCNKQFQVIDHQPDKNKTWCNQCYRLSLRKQNYQLVGRHINKATGLKKAYAIGSKIQTGGKTKWYNVQTSNGLVKVQGTYEVRMCKILDVMKNLNQIKDWQYTNDTIPYIGLDNQQHSYLIDFKVYINDNKFYYIQTKGYLHNDDQIKWKATRDAGYRLDVYFIKQLIQSEEKYNII